jgi:hypothetical protein
MVSSAPNLHTVDNLNKYKLEISLYNTISTVFVETLSHISVIYMCKKKIKCVVNSRLDFEWVCVEILIYNVYIYIYIHLIVCLTTGPKPLPKRALHIVQSRAFSFK